MKVKVKVGSSDPIVSGDTITIFTNAKREQNRANVDVMRQLIVLFHTEQSKIRLIKGAKSTNKVFLLKE